MNGAPRFSVVIPVFNAAGVVAATIRALKSVKGGDDLEIIVVDDASTDGVDRECRQLANETTILVRHESNRGRSAARNTGAAIARGTYLLFIDADATPVGPDFLLAYQEQIATNANLVFGAYTMARHDFWSRYEALSLRRALARFRKGMHYALSSRNFVIERSLFETCGGFDERYRHIGFEDRDLFLRALASGARAAIAEKAVVMHDGETTLPIVMHKLRESGRYTSQIFRRDHPKAYSLLGFSAIDANDHPILAMIAAPSAALLFALAKPLEKLLQNRHVPFPMGVAVTRMGSALSYLEGTRRSRDASG